MLKKNFLISLRTTQKLFSLKFCTENGKDIPPDKDVKKGTETKKTSESDPEITDKLMGLLLQREKSTKSVSSQQKNLRISLPSSKTKEQRKRLQKNLENNNDSLKAVNNIVSKMADENEKSKVKKELLDHLNEHSDPQISLKKLFSNMKIELEHESETPNSRSKQIKMLLGSKVIDKPAYSKYFKKYETKQPKQYLSKCSPLGIFSEPIKSASYSPHCEFWDELYQRELQQTITHPPSNAFEELILWTEQKKLWLFPIDNEQDLDEEKKVSFHEHIFLEEHLEPWCPKTGPIRHFMELVCNGLSKNPFLTVQKKKDHIFWYKEYFDKKRDVIETLMIIKE